MEKPGCFSRQRTKENEENKKLKSNNIIHCVLLPLLCIDSSSIYDD
jgi:hypothetical protein